MAGLDTTPLQVPVEAAARRLLGCELIRNIDGQELRGIIVETEAYDQTDTASHSYTGVVGVPVNTAARLGPQSDDFFHSKVGPPTLRRKKIVSSQPQVNLESQPEPRRRQGKTPRTEVMFGPAGYLYVYFTYGMHYCCNVVVGQSGHGAAVLIRALQPVGGQGTMLRNRGGRADLTNGPAKLCQAFGIDKRLNGHNLAKNPLKLIINQPLSDERIIQTTRIGIKNATDVPWRFYVRDNPFVSKL